MIDDVIDELLLIYCPEEKHREEWDIKGLKDRFTEYFLLPGYIIWDQDSLRELSLQK